MFNNVIKGSDLPFQSKVWQGRQEVRIVISKLFDKVDKGETWHFKAVFNMVMEG